MVKQGGQARTPTGFGTCIDILRGRGADRTSQVARTEIGTLMCSLFNSKYFACGLTNECGDCVGRA